MVDGGVYKDEGERYVRPAVIRLLMDIMPCSTYPSLDGGESAVTAALQLDLVLIVPAVATAHAATARDGRGALSHGRGALSRLDLTLAVHNVSAFPLQCREAAVFRVNQRLH